MKGDAATRRELPFPPGSVYPAKFQIRVFVVGDGRECGNSCQTGGWTAQPYLAPKRAEMRVAGRPGVGTGAGAGAGGGRGTRDKKGGLFRLPKSGWLAPLPANRRRPPPAKRLWTISPSHPSCCTTTLSRSGATTVG